METAAATSATTRKAFTVGVDCEVPRSEDHLCAILKNIEEAEDLPEPDHPKAPVYPASTSIKVQLVTIAFHTLSLPQWYLLLYYRLAFNDSYHLLSTTILERTILK